jgi:RND family efflux transporter MFP subunit
MNVHVQALNKDFPGKVARFADSLNEQTRTMETEIDLDNRNNEVLPGMYAEVAIPINQQHDALTVPLEAVFHADGGAEVLIVNPQNIVEVRHVTVGYQGGTRVVVLSGVQEGERVFVGNRADVNPGQTVMPKDVTVTAPPKAPASDSQGAH